MTKQGTAYFNWYLEGIRDKATVVATDVEKKKPQSVKAVRKVMPAAELFAKRDKNGEGLWSKAETQ